MMYRPVLVTPPTATPVSIDEIKTHVRASDFSDDDSILQLLLDSAVADMDGWTGILGRCLMPQTWRQDYNRLDRCLRLPLFPVLSIGSVKYDDVYGDEQTVADANYSLQNDELGAFVEFKSSYQFAAENAEKPSARIEYVAGYADAATVPPPLRTAIILDVKMKYDPLTPEQMAAYQRAYDASVAKFRRIQF